MRFIPTKTHAIIDYATGVLLIAVPLLFFQDYGGAAVWVPVIIGALVLMQSLLTNYELSLANLIPVGGHLAMDAMAGALLAASPWLFDFAELVWVPHVVVGLMEIGLALTTETHRRGAIQYPNPPRGAASA